MRYAMLAASAAAVLSAGAASAGGFVSPEVDVPVLAPVAPVVVAPSWQGGYAGVALGYAFGGDDEIGENVTGTLVDNLGKAELSGGNVTLRAGYRWQRDRWVVGPELSYMAGGIKDDFDYGTDGSFESKVNNVLALKMKTGYTVRPDTIVYGIVGWQKGDFTYVNSGTDFDYDADGYVVGLGAERMLTDRISITGEYEYTNFGKTDVEIAPDVVTKATPDYSNLKVGLNFKF